VCPSYIKDAQFLKFKGLHPVLYMWKIIYDFYHRQNTTLFCDVILIVPLRLDVSTHQWGHHQASINFNYLTLKNENVRSMHTASLLICK
jgi:hypothetical protein